MTGEPLRLILGPQRPAINLGTAMQRYGLDRGRVAVISTGWQEAEGDIDDIRRVVDAELADLSIYQRTEVVFQQDEALRDAYRLRQDRLTGLQEMYRMRLRYLKTALRQTLRAEGPAALIAAEQRHAAAQLRALDRHHLRQVATTHREFDSEFNATTRPALAAHAAEITATLSTCDTLMITGGNLLVLMNRLRLFGLESAMRNKHIVAWSAGAMLLGARVVLFHDRMPQGRRDAEIIDRGLGILPGTIVFPNISKRLRTRDALRMSALSRRFANATCLGLDNATHALFEGEALRDADGAVYPTRDGKLQPVAAR
jgi:hypothetical protein